MGIVFFFRPSPRGFSFSGARRRGASRDIHGESWAAIENPKDRAFCSRPKPRLRVSTGLARLAPRHGFGFVGTKKGSSVQILSGERAAAYLSSYFVRGSKEKATLQEKARNPLRAALLDLGVGEGHKGDRYDDAEPATAQASMGDSFASLPASVLAGGRARARDRARRLLAAARIRAAAAVAVPVPNVRPPCAASQDRAGVL